MRVKFKFVTLLALACLSVSLAAVGGGHFSAPPTFDPAPRVSPFPASRETVLNSITYAYWEDAWTFGTRFEAVFDDQGRVSCVLGYESETQPGEYLYYYRDLIDYTPDNQPLHISFQFKEGTEDWAEFANVDYGYADGLLQWYLLSGYQPQPGQPVFGPMLQVAFMYADATNILERVVQYDNFAGPIPHHVAKYDYAWDAGSRPSEIIESNLWIDRSWDESVRTTYVYHNDDQTTHAAYLRGLAWGVPYFRGRAFITGLQTSLLLEERTYLKSAGGGNWIESQRDFYTYADGPQLQQIDTYNNTGALGWQVRAQRLYAYQGVYPVTETYFGYDADSGTLLPSNRYTYGYTNLTAADDPAVPALISSLKVYPNPCNPQAGISYKLEAAGQAELAVYNLKGQKVRELLDSHASAGVHHLTWDGRDDSGNSLASGVYLIRLRSSGEARSVKVVLVK